MTALPDLLRKAGTAMLRAGLRFDIVREIEDATGAAIVLPEQLQPQHANVAQSMREVATALEKAGRPLLAEEIGAMLWPTRTVWQVRGILSHCCAAGWLETVRLRGPAKAAHYAFGTSTSWRSEARKADAIDSDLQREVEELRRRVADLTAAAAGGAK